MVDEEWELLLRAPAAAAPAAAQRSAARPPPRELADLATALGRSGRPLGELIAETSRRSLEQSVIDRRRAVLMEPHEVCVTASLCMCDEQQSGCVNQLVLIRPQLLW